MKARVGLNISTGFFSQNQSQTPSRNLTPGIIDEEDFPALAPPKAVAIAKPIVPVAIPAISIPSKKVAVSKQTTGIVSKIPTLPSAWKTKTDEEASISVSSAALLPTSSSKKRLELPKVDTFPTIIDVVKDETAPNLATPPRMIRILPTQSGFKSANSESAVSETASLSGMSSRPVSPPLQPQQQPQKKSKSALKRERRKEAEEKERELQQERLKKVEEVHAPIIGRMKKKDKKRTDGSIESPPSPHTTEKLDVPQMTMPEKRDISTNPAAGTDTATPAQTESEKPPASNKTVAQLLQEINDIHFATLEMFKPIVGIRYELHITADELAQVKIRDDTISKSEPHGQQLKHSGTTGINLRGGGTITMHQLVTPGGNVLTGLTQQQEDHFLKLEESRKREKAWERYPTTMKEWKWMPKNTLLAEMKGGGEGKVTLEELKEKVMAARKETEAFEKKLEKLLKRNKKLVGLA